MEKNTPTTNGRPVETEETRLPEFVYQKRLIKRIILTTAPNTLFYTALFYYEEFYVQAFLLGLLFVNALSGVLLMPRFKTLESLIQLKRYTVISGFTLFAASVFYGMLRVDLPATLPWSYFLPLGVVLFLGRRTGFYYASGFCILISAVVIVSNPARFATDNTMLMKISIVTVLFTLLLIALIAEKTRVRVQKDLVEARNKYQKAEENQRQANVELQREIELRRQSEKALAQSEVRYRALFEESAVSLWEEDWSKVKSYLDELPQEAADDLFNFLKQNPEVIEKCTGLIHVMAVNRATLNLYEADSTKTLLNNIIAILPPRTTNYMIERIVSLYLNRRYDAEHLAQTLNGRPLHLLISSNIPVGYEASFQKVFTSVYDVTERVAMEQERKRVDQQLQQARQMQAIGTLAGGIAHQFNNALAVIFGGLDLIEVNAKNDPKNKLFFESLQSSAGRMSRLTDQLLAYAHGGKYQPKAFSANDLICTILDSDKIVPAPSVRIATQLSPEIYSACGDITQIKMVVEAVLSNAFESLSNGGEITIATRNQVIREGVAQEGANLAPGNYAVISVQDTGVGMDQDTCRRIFEPFFTTKFFGRGLGMAAAYGIVTNHDGMITVDSTLNKGTCVTIYLPGVEAQRKTPPQVSEPPQALAS